MRSLLLALPLLLIPASASALITSPVGGRPGQLDLSTRVSLERGKIEPNENEQSWQKARWNMYAFGVGYGVGDFGPIRDLYVRVDGTYVVSPAEVNERGTVTPDRCRGVALDATRCQFHAADRGGFITPSIAWNLVHELKMSFGMFVQSSIPVGLNLDKFVQPRIDHIAGGVQTAVRLAEAVTFEARLYFGSGTFDKKQNSTVAITNLFGLEAREWLLPWKVGVKFGTYFDGDLRERTDEIYDAAYTAGYPERRDRIRMMRFGTAIFPYLQVTEHAAIELGYVQKIFGYDTPATQFFHAGVRATI